LPGLPPPASPWPPPDLHPQRPLPSFAMISAWVLLYFFCHGIAHWAVGRLLGIHFAFYTIGGTGNPEAYPAGLRWVFEHLPSSACRLYKASMSAASPMAKAIMWSAGVTSSAVVPTRARFARGDQASLRASHFLSSP